MGVPKSHPDLAVALPEPNSSPSSPSPPSPPTVTVHQSSQLMNAANCAMTATANADDSIVTYDAEENSAELVDVEVPDEPDWVEALTSPDREKWLEGACTELHILEEMEVFQLIPHSAVPSGHKVLCGKFVCCVKHDHLSNPVCMPQSLLGCERLPAGIWERLH